jgi:hypothetical protein
MVLPMDMPRPKFLMVPMPRPLMRRITPRQWCGSTFRLGERGP